MEDILDQFCDEIAALLASSTVLESNVFKPGNASRFQDIATVNYKDLVLSSILSVDSYKKTCIKGYKQSEIIYNELYKTVKRSKELDIKYSILGTQLLLLPIAYSSLLSYDITSLRINLSQVIKSLGKEDAKWFAESLKIIQPTYLGIIDKMDYRKISDQTLYEILKFSSNMDSVSRNMVLDYEYTYLAFNILKEEVIKEKNFDIAIQIAYLSILSEIPDGLIYRKFGGRIALEVSKLASIVLKDFNETNLKKFNEYLVYHKINPGSTADIIASAISLYLLEEWYEKNRHSIKLPLPRGCDRIY
ncbi:triphosphoribosyl-dephospho-CoA synthase [Acidianus sulfidivorans]|uniref:triphosphoribosyl-dephospho-CoA synthase n=1 Tax=Acidianus sulfidivorans TaxID=312539 RepID=UPI0013A5BABD|nr:triphosphoribosyl-dephospho-CoA synthase [Acidianus sulfidivorans]